MKWIVERGKKGRRSTQKSFIVFGLKNLHVWNVKSAGSRQRQYGLVIGHVVFCRALRILKWFFFVLQIISRISFCKMYYFCFRFFFFGFFFPILNQLNWTKSIYDMFKVNFFFLFHLEKNKRQEKTNERN